VPGRRAAEGDHRRGPDVAPADEVAAGRDRVVVPLARVDVPGDHHAQLGPVEGGRRGRRGSVDPAGRVVRREGGARPRAERHDEHAGEGVVHVLGQQGPLVLAADDDAVRRPGHAAVGGRPPVHGGLAVGGLGEVVQGDRQRGDGGDPLDAVGGPLEGRPEELVGHVEVHPLGSSLDDRGLGEPRRGDIEPRGGGVEADQGVRDVGRVRGDAVRRRSDDDAERGGHATDVTRGARWAEAAPWEYVPHVTRVVVDASGTEKRRKHDAPLARRRRPRLAPVRASCHRR
jgi:hypothetical protein